MMMNLDVGNKYLDESESTLARSVTFASCPFLLCLLDASLSRAFPFLNPPWNAAFAWKENATQ